jgi:D-methionine transport system permease protein
MNAPFQTLYMVFVALFFATIIGLHIGVILFQTGNRFLGVIVNVIRSFPFAILLIALIPFTRLVVGTSLGTTASIVPLAVAAAPYLARVVETSLQGVDPSLIEAARVMGSTKMQIISKVLLPEALPTLISSFTAATVNLIGYSAMAGLVGGGGLGTVAIVYGYQRFNGPLMVTTVVFLIVIVQGIQWIGDLWQRALLSKRGLK